MKKWVLYLLLILAAVSCSLFTKEKPVTAPLLSFPLEKEREIGFKGKINEVLVQSENTVYFSTSHGDLFSLDNPEQEIKQVYKSQHDFISAPFIKGPYVYLYDSENQVYCVDRKGALIWKIHMQGHISSGLCGTSEQIFLGTEKGRFVSLHVDSGELLWEFKAHGAVKSFPLVIDKNIVFGCDDNRVYFLSMDGKLIKTIETQGKVRGSLAHQKNRLFFGSQDENFYCADLNNKKIKWSVNTGGKVLAHPLIHSKSVFFTSWNNVLFCLNTKNGTIQWWNQIPARCLYPLELVGNQVLISSLSSIISSFDIKTGERVGQYNADNEAKSNPLWFQNRVLISVYDKENDQSKILFLKTTQKKKEKQ